MSGQISALLIFFFLSLQIEAQEVKVFIKDLSPTQGCNTLTTTFKTEFSPLSIDSLIINYGDGLADTILNPTYGQSHTYTYGSANDYTITLTGIKSGYTTGYASDTVHVYPLPDARFSYAPYGYPGVKDTFYFSNRRYLFIASEYPNDTTHSWFVNEIVQFGKTDSLAHNFNTIGTYSIKHKVSINGCIDSTSQSIKIENTDIKIPNVFSPNNDGINDLFYIQTDGETNYKFTIHDRNGSRVFILEGKIISWDGRTYWGEELNPGNYFYSLEPETGETQTGIIYLAR